MCCMTSAHEPTDRDAVMRFLELIGRATSVRVVEGSILARKHKNQPDLMFIENGANALAELKTALSIEPLGAKFAWMTPGGPSLELSDNAGPLLAVRCIGADFVRSDVLPEDATLTNPGSLLAWVDRHKE
jgi:hypothetical protein